MSLALRHLYAGSLRCERVRGERFTAVCTRPPAKAGARQRRWPRLAAGPSRRCRDVHLTTGQEAGIGTRSRTAATGCSQRLSPNARHLLRCPSPGLVLAAESPRLSAPTLPTAPSVCLQAAIAMAETGHQCCNQTIAFAVVDLRVSI